MAAPAKIAIALDERRFLRPRAIGSLTPAEIDAVRAICPGVALAHPRNDERDRAATYDALWGPIAGAWTGHATDPEVRFAGSSGGLLSAVLIHLLEANRVDFVLHTRASRADPLGNESTFSRTRAAVVEGAGSRYAPASPGATLADALATGQRFAFVGKPCDVAAVRNLLRSQPRLGDQIPYLVSFMCAGTPSRLGAQEVVAKMGLRESDVVSFRYRGNGWPGTARAETAHGEAKEMDYNSSWGEILNKHLQRRCKICADGTGEFADLAMADAWHCDSRGYPDFDERDGRSLVLARNQRGLATVAELVARGSVATEPVSLAEIASMQPYQKRRKQAIAARLAAMKIGGLPVPHYVRMDLRRAALDAGTALFAREFGGTLRRLVTGRY